MTTTLPRQLEPQPEESTIAHSRYYSPRLDRDLLALLSHQARAEHVPMTELASRLVREGLANEHRTTGSVVAEEPPAHDPVGRKERTDHHRQRTSPAH